MTQSRRLLCQVTMTTMTSSIIAFLPLTLILLVLNFSNSVAGDILAELDALQSSTELLLREHQQDETLTKLDSLVNELAEEHESLDKLERELIERTKELEKLIHTINNRQIEYLSKQLKDTVEAELESRSGNENETVGANDEDLSQALSMEELEEAVNGPVEKIFNDVDDALENWMVDLVGNYVVDFRKQKALDFVANAAREATLSQDAASSSSETSSSNSCITPAQGAFLIQEALLQQSSAPPDYLATAVVVHEFTSPTYEAPVTEPLGQVSWRRYIPEDIERILPEGWEDWNVALPPAMYRMMVRHIKTISMDRSIFIS